ncbi:MAG TPA: 3-deoxy-manno-octulosonate cytidylyltransferase [Luteibaculaceae bacterium]|nr:3-deoxy-manno-octulosonate cytidylyltransferase [Luteibaculaceae bacterium]
MNSVLVIIPARYASTRFPGKPLAMIHGKTMIQRVVERCSAAVGDSAVWVATDDDRILNHVRDLGAQGVMTKSTHPSGTDRVAEALENINAKPDLVINVQGDEPFVKSEQIQQLISLFKDPSTQIGTLIKKAEPSEIHQPNKVKVVTNLKGEALYFSRQAIPYLRGVDADNWHRHGSFYKHLGMYAFRAEILRELVLLPPSKLEMAESLEQLRWLEGGFRIKTAITEFETPAVDTPEDLSVILQQSNLL